MSAQTAATRATTLSDAILNDADSDVKKVGKLFLGLSFEPLAHRKVFPGLGDIDLAFKLQRDAFVFVFIVEVSHQSDDQNEKIDHFFSRWGSPANLTLFLGPLGLTGVRNMRIYVDMSRESNTADLTSIQHILGANSDNRVVFKDDIEYFQSTAETIGKWAKSDLLSYLGVPRSQTLVGIQAFQFYLDNDPAFCFVCDVRTLLDSCYIWRRLGDRKGYQRTLDEDRIRTIGKEIQGRKTAAFPNSIIINCEQPLTRVLARRDECPKSVEINLPTSHCSCVVVDGQHRLLGFSRIDETQLSQRHLPVVAFQGLSPENEVKLFVDINSKQRRIDRNLIIDLKADFTWGPDQNYREHTEQIIVRIARQLHDNGPLRGRIYFGAARETKGDKITLATFVSVIKENQLVGGKWHFWQSDPKSQDIGKPLKKIRGFFSRMLSTFSHKPAARMFLLSNMGLRMVFRAIQILERNAKAGRCTISKAVFMHDLRRALDDDLISDLRKLYGVGGKVEGTKRIIETLKGRYPKRYKALELDFRRLSARKRKKRKSRKSSK